MARRHVTTREVDAIEEYSTQLMILLGMPAWRVRIFEDPCDEDSQATIDWSAQKWEAGIALNPDWMSIPDSERRVVITHEVLHLMHARVADVAKDGSETLMASRDHELWWRQVLREFELMVDNLATVLGNTHMLEEAWSDAHSSKP